MLETTEKSELTFNFIWNDEKVAQVSRIIMEERENSEIWSTDHTAELNIIEQFKKSELLSQILTYLNPHQIEKGEKVIVTVDGFNDVLKFLMEKIDYEKI